MTPFASVSLFGPEFGDFLYAPIGDDRNGMLLSVLSALARLDLDPWQEAAELARLPSETAIQRLTSLIAMLPDGPSVYLDAETIAARLIARLPHRAGFDTPSHETLLGASAVNSRVLIYVISMALMMGAQWIIASS